MQPINQPYISYPNSWYVRGIINYTDYAAVDRYFSTTELAGNMYMYSFSMYPQNSYPSGQVNFSRILDKKLSLRLYPSSHVRYARIYARSYNVLVVNDGVAGLMFACNSDYDSEFEMAYRVTP